MDRVGAIRTLLREQKREKITKVGYAETKRALKALGLSKREQAQILWSMDFDQVAMDDPYFEGVDTGR